MIHIGKKWPDEGEAVCGGQLEDGDTLTATAMQSDCDACRAALMIGPCKERGMKPVPAPNYTPEPYADLESLESIRKRRDGR